MNYPGPQFDGKLAVYARQYDASGLDGSTDKGLFRFISDIVLKGVFASASASGIWQVWIDLPDPENAGAFFSYLWVASDVTTLIHPCDVTLPAGSRLRVLSGVGAGAAGVQIITDLRPIRGV